MCVCSSRSQTTSSPPLFLGDVILCNVKMEAGRGLATGD